jgi:hypothetical protein
MQQDEPIQFTSFSTEELVLFAAVLSLGAVAGAFRSLRDQSYQSTGNFCGLCGTAGFLSFACVAFLSKFWIDLGGNEFFHLGVAAFVGLLGKEADLLTRWILQETFKKFGVKDERKSGDTPK